MVNETSKICVGREQKESVSYDLFHTQSEPDLASASSHGADFVFSVLNLRSMKIPTRVSLPGTQCCGSGLGWSRNYESS
jgi:hypothetical protein